MGGGKGVGNEYKIVDEDNVMIERINE